MKNSKALQLLLMAGMFSPDNPILQSHKVVKTPEEKLEELGRKKAKAKVRNNKRKGLTEYHFGDGRSLWALNEKTADKKARKKGWK